MHFGNPIFLWLLALLPVYALLGWLAGERWRRTQRRLGDHDLVAKLHAPTLAAWRRRRWLAGMVAFGLLAFAAARPQYGRVEQTLKRRGVDVIIAIDTSPSMMADDVKPNRLERAKESLKRLLRSLEGNRVGIVAFAGDAFLLCPMTLDHSLASLVLESIDVNTVGIAGTDLGRAIEVSADAFRRGGAASPALVLITDGEDNEGRGLTVAERVAAEGVEIYAIGVGSERGAPVPDTGKGYKEDAQGNKVVSQLNLETLSSISEATGGVAYVAQGDPRAAINALMLRIDRISKSDLESRKVVLYRDRYIWFLAPAMVLLLWLLVTRPEQAHTQAAYVMEERSA